MTKFIRNLNFFLKNEIRFDKLILQIFYDPSFFQRTKSVYMQNIILE